MWASIRQFPDPMLTRPAAPLIIHRTALRTHLQAIAFTAGFHFAFIEQAGTSLYATLAQNVTSREVLRILLSIGGSEIMHFQTWQDKAGNALPLTDVDPVTGATVTFVNLAEGQPETLQANLIMPEPCDFIRKDLPQCAIIRPTGPGQIDAAGAIKGFISDGLFIGQPQAFQNLLLEMAEEADEASRSSKRRKNRALCSPRGSEEPLTRTLEGEPSSQPLNLGENKWSDGYWPTFPI